MRKRKVYSSRISNSKILDTRRRHKRKDNNLAANFKKFLKLLSITVILVGIYFIFNNDYLKIKNIEIKTNNDFTEEIKEIVNNHLKTNKFFIIPNSNFITLNTNDLEELIKKEVPEIKSIKVKKRLPDKLEIENTLHEATIGWETQEKRYLLNEEGYILKETDKLDGFVYVKDSTNLPLDKNKQVVYPNFITFIKQINDKLTNISIKISYLEIKETTFMINCYTDNGFKIIFNTTKSIEDQISKLTEAINFLGGNIKSLDYIDVTVKNKAIYKLK